MPGHDARRGDPPAVRLRRAAVTAAALVLLVAAIDYASAMSGRSNTALGVRSVEWLRDNGAASIVATVENWYYSLTAPSKGGPTLRSLPQVGDAAAARRTTPAATTTPARNVTTPGTTTTHARTHGGSRAARRTQRQAHRHLVVAARPQRVRPMLHPALPGE